MDAGLEYGGLLGPKLILISGWFVCDSSIAVSFGVSPPANLKGISNLFLYDRKDLNEITLSNIKSVQRKGFFATLTIEDPDEVADNIELDFSNGGKRSLPLLSMDIDCERLEKFFNNTWQPIRRRCLDLLCSQPLSAFFSESYSTLKKLTKQWIDEIDEFSGSFAKNCKGGIDQAFYSESGHIYVQGWKLPSRQEKNKLSVSVSGLRAEQIFLWENCVRRPDVLPESIRNNNFIVPGFIIAGIANVPFEEASRIYIVFELYEGQTVHYSKVMLQKVATSTITNYFWKQILDFEKLAVHPASLGAISSCSSTFASVAANDLYPIESKRLIKYVFLLDIEQDCKFTRMMRSRPLSREASDFGFVFVSSAYQGTIVDPNHRKYGQMPLMNKFVGSIFDALLSFKEDGFALIVSPGTLFFSPIVDDLNLYRDAIVNELNDNILLVIPEEIRKNRQMRRERSMQDKLGVLEASAKELLSDYTRSEREKLILNKGGTIPPLIIRVSLLRSLLAQRWPHIISALDLWPLIVSAGQADKLTYIVNRDIKLYRKVPDRFNVSTDGMKHSFELNF